MLHRNPRWQCATILRVKATSAKSCGRRWRPFSRSSFFWKQSKQCWTTTVGQSKPPTCLQMSWEKRENQLMQMAVFVSSKQKHKERRENQTSLWHDFERGRDALWAVRLASFLLRSERKQWAFFEMFDSILLIYFLDMYNEKYFKFKKFISFEFEFVRIN